MPSMMERAVCLNLSLAKLGTRRKAATETAGAEVADQVAADAVVSGADAACVSASKRLLDCAELKAVGALDSEIKAYLGARALPSPFRGGIWLIPLTMAEEIDLQLQTYRTRRGELVSAFLAVYREAIDAARERLGPLFSPSDYATENEARAAFGIEWQFVSMDTPSALRNVSAAMFERERERAEALWRDASEDIRQALRVSLQELITHTAERLRQRPDGTRPVLRDSVLGNLSEFLEFFEARNLTDDAELGALVERAREVIAGIETDELRRNPDMRQSIGNAVAALMPSADDLVNAPKRRIVLGGAAAETRGSGAPVGGEPAAADAPPPSAA